MINTGKSCRVCGVRLVVGENLSPSQAANNMWRCHPCTVKYIKSRPKPAFKPGTLCTSCGKVKLVIGENISAAKAKEGVRQCKWCYYAKRYARQKGNKRQWEKDKALRRKNFRKYYRENTAAVLAKNEARHARTKGARTGRNFTVAREGVHAARVHMMRMTGEKWEVDHIIPIKGVTLDCDRQWMRDVGLTHNVSGLDVPWNWQLLTTKENREKGANANPEHAIAPEEYRWLHDVEGD